MKPANDRPWRAADADGDPSWSELQQAERDLAEIGSFAPLSAAQIDTMVAAATAAAARPVTPLRPGLRRRSTARRLAAAAGLLLACSTLAWVGSSVLWRGKNSVFELTTATAVQMTGSTTVDGQSMVSALLFLDERCSYAIQVLRDLRADPTSPQLADAAERLLVQVEDRLGTTRWEPLDPGTDLLLEHAHTARDQGLPIEQRLAALRQLGGQALAMATAISRANLRGELAQQRGAKIRARLLREASSR